MKYLKIKNLESKVYYDRDYIMFHAVFQILIDFLEKEFFCNSGLNFKYDCFVYDDIIHDMKILDERYIKTMYNMFDLYDWYYDYIENDDIQAIINDEVINEKIKEVVDLRLYMWT